MERGFKMKKTKAFVLIADNEFDLVKIMNQSEKKFFASQPIQKQDGSWVCFIYYESKEEKQNENRDK